MLERLFASRDGLPGLFRAAYVDDATVALAMAALLFMIPAGGGGGAAEASGPTGGRYLMDWETAQRLPWGVLLLFGGGFCVAAAFRDSGLSHWCGSVFAAVDVRNPLLLVVATCLLLTFLTELTSNTATTQVMLPILARVSHAMGVDPLMLMIPATVSASCAFMLPVATPPNAIVFGADHLTVRLMAREGLVLNLIGVVVVTGVCYLMFG
jgi:sodium-dependent dicarboxylate transporter 2/3/5